MLLKVPLGDNRVRESRMVVVCGLALAVFQLFLAPFQSSPRTDFLSVLSDAALSLLIAIAAWRASRRSRAYARVLWLCVGFAALLWMLNSMAASAGLFSGALKTAI